jgi:hypothetical protein
MRISGVVRYRNCTQPMHPIAVTTSKATQAQSSRTWVGATYNRGSQIEATRRDLEAHDVTFLTVGIASVAGVRTTWFRDPWGVIFILVEKRDPDRPYWRQHA